MGRRDGVTQEIPQGEGGEQGDPLMPMLFSLGQQAALEAIKQRLRDDEKLFAFLDDLTVVCRPDRVADVTSIVSQELQAHAHISVHHGKTQVWNRGGVEPEGVEELTRRARLVKRDAVVWKGDPTLPAGDSHLGGTSWVRGVCSEPVGTEVNRTRDPLPPDSICAGHPGVLVVVVVVDVRGNTGQFLAAYGATGPGPELRRAPRSERVAVSPCHFGHRSSTGSGQGFVQLAVVSRRIGAQLRCQV